MLDCMDLIAEHMPTERSKYDADVVVRFFLLKQVEIIGEASYKMDRDFKSKHPEIPWKKIEGARHIFVHDYFDLDWDILWDILVIHLPTLRERIHELVHGSQGD
jgi:uncharacterized protein with HEPN domain